MNQVTFIILFLKVILISGIKRSFHVSKCNDKRFEKCKWEGLVTCSLSCIQRPGCYSFAFNGKSDTWTAYNILQVKSENATTDLPSTSSTNVSGTTITDLSSVNTNKNISSPNADLSSVNNMNLSPSTNADIPSTTTNADLSAHTTNTGLSAHTANARISAHTTIARISAHTTNTDRDIFSVSMIRDLSPHTTNVDFSPVNINRGHSSTTLIADSFSHTINPAARNENKSSELLTVNNEPKLTIHRACALGKVKTVLQLLKRGDVINSRDSQRRTPIMVAAENGHLPVVSVLYRKKCDMTAVDNTKSNVLHLASGQGHLAIVRFLVSTVQMDINARKESSLNPVFVAALNDHTAVVKYLLKKGCAVTNVSKYKMSILHSAARGGAINTLSYLLIKFKNKLPIYVPDKIGRTPLHYAVYCGQISAVKFLERKGASLTTISQDHNNCLHFAVSSSSNIDMLKYIWSKTQLSLESKGRYGNTPLLSAGYAGTLNIVKFLVGNGANIKATDNKRANLLHLSCRGGHLNMVKYVYSLKIFDIDCLDRQRRSPVLHAAEEGHVEVIVFLVKHGCDVKIKRFGRGIIGSAPKIVKSRVAQILKDIRKLENGS